MSSARGGALQLVVEAPRADRGKLLSIDDVIALFPTRPDGKPSRSRWWVTHYFCPGGKKKLGQQCYWWEGDALAWIDSQTATRSDT